jgi:hypothetical protein
MISSLDATKKQEVFDFLISGREQIAGTNRDVIFFLCENIGSFRVLSKKKKKKRNEGKPGKRLLKKKKDFLDIVVSLFLFLLFLFPFLETSSIHFTMTISRKECLNRLDYYYRAINTTIISRQNPASGLIPASVAITVSCNNRALCSWMALGRWNWFQR